MAVCNLEGREVYWITNRISRETVVYANAVVQDYETFFRWRTTELNLTFPDWHQYSFVLK